MKPGYFTRWPASPPKARRDLSFGLLEIDGARPAPAVKAKVGDETGQVRLSQTIDTATLVV